MSSPSPRLVTTTLPTEADARRIAETLVGERLAACAQVQGPIASTYRWQGQVDHATEWYVHCKTSSHRAGALIARIKALHPYELPEIIELPILGGHPPYLEWIAESTREP